jgi:diacylglycerol kinase family enzyme
MAEVATKRLISLIINTSSGSRLHESEPIDDVLVRYFTAHGCDVELYMTEQFYALPQLTLKIATRHQNNASGIIVVAGGDGTLNAVAQKLLHGKTPMGIIPLGTFNYFARALGIPLDPLEAANVVLNCDLHTIHVGRVNQSIYINNAAIGLYPRLIEQREHDHHRFGRFRFVAKISGLISLMREQQKLKLKLMIDGQIKPIESPLVFFGNNQFQLQEYNLKLAECAAQGKLAVVAITEISKLQTLKLVARLQRIESKARHMKVAIDGEIIYMQTPLNFSVLQSALTVIAPKYTGVAHATPSL